MIMSYLRSVLIRLIVGYLMFGLMLLMVFFIYFIFGDLDSAINFFMMFVNNTFGKIILFLPVFTSLFGDNISHTQNSKKWSKETTGFLKLTNHYGGVR